MADKKKDDEQAGTPVDPRPSKATPVEAAEPVRMPSAMGATFAERRAAREKAAGKAVSRAEDKSVSGGEQKSRR